MFMLKMFMLKIKIICHVILNKYKIALYILYIDINENTKHQSTLYISIEQ